MDYARSFILLLSLLLNKRIMSVQAFDYFALVLQWPGTVCDLDQCPNNWTIHGLWPQNNRGKHPFFCPREEFDDIHLKNISDKMIATWPSLLKRTNSTSFWAHEWKKHGTCSNLSQSEYFEKTLKLTANLNIKGILEDKNIMPGQSKAIGDLIRAVMDRTNHRSFLTNITKTVRKCAQKKKEHWLKEIYICYDREFKSRDCGRENKNLALTIFYPKVQQQVALPQVDDGSCTLDTYDHNGQMQFGVSPAVVLLLSTYMVVMLARLSVSH